MAAFDMLVSNNDRFRPEGVNLQNVDLHGTQGVSLDVVDPNTPLRTPDTWEGEAIFGAPTTWALNTVGGMCDTLGVNRLYLQTVLNAFLTGFQLAKTQLKAQEQQYRAQGMTLAGHGQAAAGSPTYAVIARRLHKI